MTLRNAFEDLATEATLASLNTKTPALSGGRVPVADSSTRGAGAVDAATVRTTQASDSPLAVSQGAPADAAATTDTGTFSLIALVKRALQNWTTLLGRVPALTVTSTRLLVDGSGVTQPVSAASLPLPTGAATAANQTTGNTSLSSAVTSLQSIDTKTPTSPATSRCYRAVTTITRPANVTPYGAGDVIGDVGGSAIVTFTNIGPSGGFVQIQSLRLLIYSGTPPTSMTGLRLHLFQTSPGAIADNALWDFPSGDRTGYLDVIDLPTPTDYGSTLFTKADFPGSLLRLANGSTSLFGLLQTPTAATFAENSTVLDFRVNAIEMGI